MFQFSFPAASWAGISAGRRRRAPQQELFGAASDIPCAPDDRWTRRSLPLASGSEGRGLFPLFSSVRLTGPWPVVIPPVAHPLAEPVIDLFTGCLQVLAAEVVLPIAPSRVAVLAYSSLRRRNPSGYFWG